MSPPPTYALRAYTLAPTLPHPCGNDFPNTGRKFRPFSGKSFPCVGDDVLGGWIMLGEDRAVATSQGLPAHVWWALVNPSSYVRRWGQSRLQFRAAGGLLVASLRLPSCLL